MDTINHFFTSYLTAGLQLSAFVAMSSDRQAHHPLAAVKPAAAIRRRYVVAPMLSACTITPCIYRL